MDQNLPFPSGLLHPHVIIPRRHCYDWWFTSALRLGLLRDEIATKAIDKYKIEALWVSAI